MTNKSIIKTIRVDELLDNAVLERIAELDINYSEYVRLSLLHSIKTLKTEQVGELKQWVLAFNPINSPKEYPINIRKNRKVKKY